VEGTYEKAKQLREVVDDVLDISKINMQAVELESLSFDVVMLIDTMINNPTETDRWGQVVHGTRSCEPTRVVGDPFRIQQVLKKFITFCSVTNGAGDNSVVQVMVLRSNVLNHRPDRSLDDGAKTRFVFQVCNPELQVPQNEIDNMFGDVTAGEPGILRMSVCKKLADLLGGSVSCQSSPRNGTVLNLTVDLQVHEDQNAPLEDLSGPMSRASRMGRKQSHVLGHDSAHSGGSPASSDHARTPPGRGGLLETGPKRRPANLLPEMLPAAPPTQPLKNEAAASTDKAKVNTSDDTDNDDLPAMRARVPISQDPHSLSQRLVADFRKRGKEGTYSASPSPSARSLKKREQGYAKSSRSTLQRALRKCRLPDDDYDFIVLREVFQLDYVAVLGSLTVSGITRQAWGCARLRGDAATSADALAQAGNEERTF